MQRINKEALLVKTPNRNTHSINLIYIYKFIFLKKLHTRTSAENTIPPDVHSGQLGTHKNAWLLNKSPFCLIFLPSPPLWSNSNNTELNSSIPFALFKSTVVLDEASLCTSMSKHRQSMYNVWLCSKNLRPSICPPRLFIKKYTNVIRISLNYRRK